MRGAVVRYRQLKVFDEIVRDNDDDDYWLGNDRMLIIISLWIMIHRQPSIRFCMMDLKLFIALCIHDRVGCLT